MSTNTIDIITPISLNIKNTLTIIFSDSSDKISKIDYAIGLTNNFISTDKISEFTNIVKKIIAAECENEKTVIKILDMLEPIKEIIDELYSELMLVKSDISYTDRNFIKNNIDIIVQTVILESCKELVDFGLVNQDEFIQVLIFIKTLYLAKIDMSVRKRFSIC